MPPFLSPTPQPSRRRSAPVPPEASTSIAFVEPSAASYRSSPNKRPRHSAPSEMSRRGTRSVVTSEQLNPGLPYGPKKQSAKRQRSEELDETLNEEPNEETEEDEEAKYETASEEAAAPSIVPKIAPVKNAPKKAVIASTRQVRKAKNNINTSSTGRLPADTVSSEVLQRRRSSGQPSPTKKLKTALDHEKDVYVVPSDDEEEDRQDEEEKEEEEKAGEEKDEAEQDEEEDQEDEDIQTPKSRRKARRPKAKPQKRAPGRPLEEIMREKVKIANKKLAILDMLIEEKGQEIMIQSQALTASNADDEDGSYFIEEGEGSADSPLVIGDDGEVERVQVEAFGERKRRNARSSGRRVDDSLVLEDRPWNEQENEAIIRGVSKYRGPERIRLIKNHYRALSHRSESDILERAKDIKQDFLEMPDIVLDNSWESL